MLHEKKYNSQAVAALVMLAIGVLLGWWSNQYKPGSTLPNYVGVYIGEKEFTICLLYTSDAADDLRV